MGFFGKLFKKQQQAAVEAAGPGKQLEAKAAAGNPNAQARVDAVQNYAANVAAYRALTETPDKQQWLYNHPYMEARMRTKGDLTADEVNYLLGGNGDPFSN